MSQGSAVAKVEAGVPATEANNMVAMIERLARAPEIDVGKLEKLLEMQERIMDRQAKAEFMAALAEMKPKLPVIDRKGRLSNPRLKQKVGGEVVDRRTGQPIIRAARPS